MKFLVYLSWLFTFTSIAGNILLIYKKRIGWLVWTLVNVAWVWYFGELKIYASCFLFFVYTILSAWGWCNWEKDAKN